MDKGEIFGGKPSEKNLFFIATDPFAARTRERATQPTTDETKQPSNPTQPNAPKTGQQQQQQGAGKYCLRAKPWASKITDKWLVWLAHNDQKFSTSFFSKYNSK